MRRVQFIVLAACMLAASANSQSTIVNVDVGEGAAAYSGQGAIDDPGNDFWNSVADSGTNLLASDQTQTTISVTTTGGVGFTDAGITNDLLQDYRYVTGFFGSPVGGIEISGLQASTDYILYVYSAGNAADQAGVITLNDVTGCTAGSTSTQLIEGDNYVILEVESDPSGVISGTWVPFTGFGAINGFQIMPGTLPTHVEEIEGSESPNVHSPGDSLRVTVSFTGSVSLSQPGAAELDLDIDGTLVTAVHTGETQGESLTFEAVAPSVTTMNTKVVANSLRLLGATLQGSDMMGVVLDHEETALPNDQISTVGLSVYPMPPAPAPNASPHYSFRVREIGGPWHSSFAWFTKCIDDVPNPPFGYYNGFIGGWSHSYCNFEMANNVPIEVEITRLDPVRGIKIDIETAIPHPRRKVRSWRVEGGRAYVRLDRPALFAVDIDGDMDENPTPSPEFINETALHGVSIFANPFILDKPDINDPDVRVVNPGEMPPYSGTWSTLYFAPGVHQLFPGPLYTLNDAFRLTSDKSYYIPGDAIVHGTMNNGDDDADSQNIRVFGHGTLSGERIDHPIELGFVAEAEELPFRSLRVASDATNCRVEGITIADPAHHSLAVVGGYNPRPEDYNYVRWCKAISWRANGDGIAPNGSGYVEDCFLRTQDDGTYIQGFGIRRMVYWTDVNGMPLRCSQMTRDNPAPLKEPLIVEDIDVIYARAVFFPGSDPVGRSVIGYPSPNPGYPGNTGSKVIFRNIRVSDPFPTRRLFGWNLGDTSGGGNASGLVSGVRFENVRAAAPQFEGEKDAFFGIPVAPIQGLIFDNVTLAGEQYDDMLDFDTNAEVSAFDFESTAPETMTYQNDSGYGKWYIEGDWDTGVEPASNDIVEHTAVADELIVDAPVYAGTLTLSHVDTATISVEAGGELTIADAISIGASGEGQLNLTGGSLRIESALGSALSVAKGSIHFESGKILWAGDRVSEVQALYAAKALTFANSNSRPDVTLRGTLIGRSGTNRLYARYDATSGYTTIAAFDVRNLRRGRDLRFFR